MDVDAKYRVRDLPAKLAEKVEVNEETGCWEWTGTCATNRGGYGVAYYEKKNHRVHRLAFQLLVGPIVEETVDHLCFNTRCLNPEHLEQIPHALNSWREHERRAAERGIKLERGKCFQGHPLSGENLMEWTANGRPMRGCRACKVARGKARDHGALERARYADPEKAAKRRASKKAYEERQKLKRQHG